jgi:hypothetical protein
MAWQRVERQATINSLLITTEKQGKIPYDDALKFIMNLHMLSRLTAERYLEDLLFQEKLTLKDRTLILGPNYESKTKKTTETNPKR